MNVFRPKCYFILVPFLLLVLDKGLSAELPPPILKLDTPEYLTIKERYTAQCTGYWYSTPYASTQQFTWALYSPRRDVELIRVFDRDGRVKQIKRNGEEPLTSWFTVLTDKFHVEDGEKGSLKKFSSSIAFIARHKLHDAVLMCYSVNALSQNTSATHPLRAATEPLKIYYPTKEAILETAAHEPQPGQTFTARCSAYVGSNGVLLWIIEYWTDKRRNVVDFTVTRDELSVIDAPSVASFSNLNRSYDESLGQHLSVDLTLSTPAHWKNVKLNCSTFDPTKVTGISPKPPIKALPLWRGINEHPDVLPLDARIHNVPEAPGTVMIVGGIIILVCFGILFLLLRMARDDPDTEIPVDPDTQIPVDSNTQKSGDPVTQVPGDRKSQASSNDDKDQYAQSSHQSD